jgi:hypothetical protein
LQPVPQRMRADVPLSASPGDVVSAPDNRDENGEGSELVTDERDKKTGRFAPGNKGGGRPRIPDEIREMIRAATPKAFKKLVDQLDAMKTVVVPCGRDAYTEEVPDGDLQHKAAVVLAAYGVGKPSEKLQLEDPDGNPMRLGIVLLPAPKGGDE